MTPYTLLEKLEETLFTEKKGKKIKEKPWFNTEVFKKTILFRCFLPIIIFFFQILASYGFTFSLVTIQLPHTVIKKAQHLLVMNTLFDLPLVRLIIQGER